MKELELSEGQIVFVRPRSARIFSADGAGTEGESGMVA